MWPAETDFFELFPYFQSVPDNIGQSRMMSHLTRERYGLDRLNFTHHEWEREAVAKLREAGYVIDNPVWQADPGNPDEGQFRRILSKSPKGEDLRIFYFLGPKVEPLPVPTRLKTRFIQR